MIPGVHPQDWNQPAPTFCGELSLFFASMVNKKYLTAANTYPRVSQPWNYQNSPPELGGLALANFWHNRSGFRATLDTYCTHLSLFPCPWSIKSILQQQASILGSPIFGISKIQRGSSAGQRAQISDTRMTVCKFRSDILRSGNAWI